MLNTNVAFREPIQKSFRKLSTFYKPSRKERQEYLKSIGLQFDPFRNPVAEQELFPEEEKKDRSPAFFDYFVPPELELPEGKMLLDVLRESKPVFVFGRPGDGKTSLRYNLDADLRNFHDGTLSVPYTLGKDVEGPLSLDEHYARLARNLMIALFIQIVEQFNPINPPPTDDQLSAFRFVLRVGGRSLKRVANRILKGSEPEARYGIGSYWAAIGQTAVRFVNRSEGLLDLIDQAYTPNRSTFLLEENPDWEEILREGIKAANLWGFSRVFVLIDGVDMKHRSDKEMFALIEPLLYQQQSWIDTAQLYYKWFLPLSLMKQIKSIVDQGDLPPAPYMLKLEWDRDSLYELMKQRFRAAKANRLSLDDLSGADLKDGLDNVLLNWANKSPRHLIAVTSAVIDAHISRNSDDFITQEDIKTAVEQRGYHLFEETTT